MNKEYTRDELISLLMRDVCFYFITDKITDLTCRKGHPKNPVESMGIEESHCKDCPDYIPFEAMRQ